MSNPSSRNSDENSAGVIAPADANEPAVNAEQQADDNRGAATVQRVNVKVPPFWYDCPEIWFAQVEAQFSISDLKSDKFKFNTVVGAMESKVLRQVSEAILNPPRDGKYDNLKRLILDRYSDSAQTKIQKLLSEMSLGDQRPSQLLAEMRRLGGTTVTDDFMRTLWLKTLPQQVQAILSISDGTLAQQAVLADKILEVSQGASVHSVAQQQSPAACAVSRETVMEKQIAQLTRAVERLTTHHSRNDAPSSSRRRGQSRSRSRNLPDRRRVTTPANDAEQTLCWFHRTYGDAATKCKEPCTRFVSKN